MSFLEILLQTPVFQGVSRVRLTNCLEKYSLEFLKFKAGDQILSKGELSTHVKFIISGQLVSYVENNTGVLKVKEIYSAPSIIAGNYVFGMETSSIYDVFAHTNVGVMQIKKEDFIDLLRKDPIFNLNYLNYLSVRSQSYFHTMMSVTSGDLKERIAMWVLILTHKRAEEIVLQVTLGDFATLLGDTLDNLRLALGEFSRQKLLTYTDNEIIIKNRHGIVDFLHDIDDAD